MEPVTGLFGSIGNALLGFVKSLNPPAPKVPAKASIVSPSPIGNLFSDVAQNLTKTVSNLQTAVKPTPAPVLTPVEQQISQMTPVQKLQTSATTVKDIAQGLAQAAVKFGVSTYQVPQTILSGGIAPDAIPIPKSLQGILGEDKISSYQTDTANDIKNGMNPLLAVGKNAGQMLMDAWITKGFADPIMQLTIKGLAKSLSDDLLYKVAESKIPVEDIMNGLRGTGTPSAEAKSFINDLSADERKNLFGLARAYESGGVENLPVQSKQPTELGKFLGLTEEGKPTVPEVRSEKKLPGYTTEPGLNIGLRTEEVKPTGFGAEDKNLSIVRHGSAVDEKTAMGGWTDTPLSEQGKQEAADAGKNLVKGTEKIYSSDVGRAKETTNIISKESGVKDITYDKGLRSWNLGKYAGTDPKTTEPILEDYAKNKPDEKLPGGGESFNEYKNRFLSTVKKIQGENVGRKIAIVTHSHGTRILDAWAVKGKPADLSIDQKTYDEKALKPGGVEKMPSAGEITPPEAKAPQKSLQSIKEGIAGRAGLKKVGLAPEKNMITRQESTLLNERIKAVARGVRMGATATKKEIADTQNELADIIRKSDLDLNNKGKFLATIKNIQTNAQLVKELPEIETRIQNMTDAAEKRELLGQIKSELSEPLYVGNGDKRISKYSPSVTEKLKSFKDELSFKDPNSLKMKELEITKNWINEHPNEPMPEDVLESLDELQRTHLKLLSPSELKDQLENIQSLKTQGKTYKALKLEQIARQRDAVIEQFKTDITGGKGIAQRKPVIENQKKPNLIKRWATNAKDFLYTKQLLADNIFDILDEKSGMKIYGGRIHDKFINLNSFARDARITGTQSALRKMAPLLEKVKKNLMNAIDFGDGVKLTRNEMIDIYMRSHDPAQIESLIEGNNISSEKIGRIIDALTPDEKAVAEAALKHWDENYDAMNKVFRERHFFDMPHNSGYSPMPKDMDYVGDEDVNLVKQQLEYVKASVPKGMTKARTGSLAPIRLGFVQNFSDGVARAEHYKAYELPIQEMNAVAKGIREVVVQEYGIDYYRLIEDYIQKAANQGRYDSSYLARSLLKLRASTSAGILGLNLVTSVKHAIASIGGAMTELTEKQYAKGIATYISHLKDWNVFWDKVPQFAERAKSATRELAEVAGQKGTLAGLLGKTNIREKAMFLIRGMDKWAVRSEATAVYLRERAAGATAEQGIQAAVSKLRRTQTGGSPEDLPSLMTGGTIEKMLTMFATERNKYANLLYGYSRAYAKGRIPFRQFARVLFYAWAFTGLMMEEARTGGKAGFGDLATAVAIGPLEDLLIIGPIIEAVRTGYQYDSSPVFSLLSNLTTYMGQLSKGKWLPGLEGLGVTFGTAAGLPINPVKRIGTGAVNLLTGQTDDWRQLIWSASALNEKAGSSELSQILSDQAKNAKDLTAQAELKYKELKGLPPDEAAKQYDELAKQNLGMAKKIAAIATEDKAGLTAEDRQLKALNVANRSAYLITQINKLGTTQEKSQYWDSMVSKGIITKAVNDKIQSILQESGGWAQAEDNLPSYQSGNVSSNKGIIHDVVTYAQAVGTDPLTAFNRIFTGQKILRIDNGTVIVQRMSLQSSESIKSKLGATSSMILDHIIPLEIGGSNGEDNLQLQTADDAAKKDIIENYLGEQLRAGKVSKNQAQSEMMRFVKGQLSQSDIIKQ